MQPGTLCMIWTVVSSQRKLYVMKLLLHDLSFMCLSQVKVDRRRLRRGETVEVYSPSGSLDARSRLRERPLGRCHTLDTHTPNTPECNETGNTNIPETAGGTDDPQQEMNETQSTDDCNCTGGETSNVSPHSDNSFEAPHTESHQTNSCSASHEPPDADNKSASTSLLPVNGASEESPDKQTHTLSNPNQPSDLQSPDQTEQTDANQAADLSAESFQWGRCKLKESFKRSVSEKTKENTSSDISEDPSAWTELKTALHTFY